MQARLYMLIPLARRVSLSRQTRHKLASYMIIACCVIIQARPGFRCWPQLAMISSSLLSPASHLPTPGPPPTQRQQQQLRVPHDCTTFCSFCPPSCGCPELYAAHKIVSCRPLQAADYRSIWRPGNTTCLAACLFAHGQVLSVSTLLHLSLDLVL